MLCHPVTQCHPYYCIYTPATNGHKAREEIPLPQENNKNLGVRWLSPAPKSWLLDKTLPKCATLGWNYDLESQLVGSPGWDQCQHLCFPRGRAHCSGTFKSVNSYGEFLGDYGDLSWVLPGPFIPQSWPQMFRKEAEGRAVCGAPPPCLLQGLP